MVYHPINSLGGMRTGSYASFLYIFKASVFPAVSAGKMDSFILFGGEDDEETRLLRCPWYPERRG